MEKEEILKLLKLVYEFLKDFQGSIIALISIIITYPILKKKLLETHISNTLNDIQKNNKLLIISSTELIDRYLPLTYSDDIVSLEELIYLKDEITELQKLSINANKDSNTFLILLKLTLQNLSKIYDSKLHSTITTREIFGIIIQLLEKVIFFSTQVVQIPKSSKTTTKNLINKKVSKFVSHSEFEKYKYFKQGFINDVKSAHSLLFYSVFCSISTKMITRSAFKVFDNNFPIQCIAFTNEFYAPMYLEIEDKFHFFGKTILKLMGFTVKEDYISKKKTIELNYTNTDDNYSFVENLKKEDFINKFKDIYIEDSKFELNKMKNFKKQNREILSIEFDIEYCQKSFKINKRKMKKIMKKN